MREKGSPIRGKASETDVTGQWRQKTYTGKMLRELPPKCSVLVKEVQIAFEEVVELFGLVNFKRFN